MDEKIEIPKVEKQQSKFTTLKATRETSNKLKILASQKKMKMYELLDEIINKVQ